MQRLRATGGIRRPVLRRRTGRSEENIFTVLTYIQFHPQVSPRTLSLELGITRTTVQNILQENRWVYFSITLKKNLNILEVNRISY